jgi:photosystem II stability/assembly factor-like uncharacterized protein
MRPQILAFIVATYAMGGGWESLGPFGGSAATVQVDPHHAGTLLAATSNAQLFRSEDSGDSWKALPFPAQLRATLHALAVDQQNPGVYFAGLSGDASQFSGIMRSSDGGLTWTRIAEPGLRAVWSLAIWPQDSRVIAAGGENGLWLTRDGGATWERVTPWDNLKLDPVVSLTFDSRDSKILYAGTPHLAWKTTDGGATWQMIHERMLDDSDVFSILVDNQRTSRIFAATCGGICRSLDGGTGWSKLIQANPLQPSVLLAGTSLGLVKSVDGGNTWRKLSSQSTHWIAFDPVRPNRIYVATDDAGLFRSDDAGESLKAINQGFSNRPFATLAAAENALSVTTGVGSIFRRSDSQPQWEKLSHVAPQPMQPATRPSADDLRIHGTVTMEDGDLLAATSRGLGRSNNAGSTWQLVPGALEGTTVGALCRHPARPGVLFASTFTGIFGSRDHGRTWRLLASGVDRPDDFIALLMLPGNPDRLFALSRNRGVFVMVLPQEWQN